jgi:hypothetical protein
MTQSEQAAIFFFIAVDRTFALGALVMPGRFVLPFLLLAVASGAYDDAGQPPIDRRSFPEGFVFGTASAACQVSTAPLVSHLVNDQLMAVAFISR